MDWQIAERGSDLGDWYGPSQPAPAFGGGQVQPSLGQIDVSGGDGREQSTREKYQEAAFKKLGVSKATFDTMDPIQRNKLITRAYGKMYMSDPDAMKWSGMAAYVSDTVGFGMRNNGAFDLLPGPDAKQFGNVLAQGNAAVFEDIFWQQVAFQQCGVAALEQAAKEGQLNKDQLESWKKIAESKRPRVEAEKTGNPELKKQAEALV
jgi:hypothetical protein